MRMFAASSSSSSFEKGRGGKQEEEEEEGEWARAWAVAADDADTRAYETYVDERGRERKERTASVPPPSLTPKASLASSARLFSHLGSLPFATKGTEVAADDPFDEDGEGVRGGWEAERRKARRDATDRLVRSNGAGTEGLAPEAEAFLPRSREMYVDGGSRPITGRETRARQLFALTNGDVRGREGASSSLVPSNPTKGEAREVLGSGAWEASGLRRGQGRAHGVGGSSVPAREGAGNGEDRTVRGADGRRWTSWAEAATLAPSSLPRSSSVGATARPSSLSLQARRRDVEAGSSRTRSREVARRGGQETRRGEGQDRKEHVTGSGEAAGRGSLVPLSLSDSTRAPTSVVRSFDAAAAAVALRVGLPRQGRADSVAARRDGAGFFAPSSLLSALRAAVRPTGKTGGNALLSARPADAGPTAFGVAGGRGRDGGRDSSRRVRFAEDRSDRAERPASLAEAGRPAPARASGSLPFSLSAGGRKTEGRSPASPLRAGETGARLRESGTHDVSSLLLSTARLPLHALVRALTGSFSKDGARKREEDRALTNGAMRVASAGLPAPASSSSSLVPSRPSRDDGTRASHPPLATGRARRASAPSVSQSGEGGGEEIARRRGGEVAPFDLERRVVRSGGGREAPRVPPSLPEGSSRLTSVALPLA